MPTYLITAPDGRKFKVTGEGSAEDAMAIVQKGLAEREQKGPDFSQADPGPRDPRSAMLENAMAQRDPHGSIADPIAQGLTFGFNDELGGVIGGAAYALKGRSFSEGYDKATAIMRRNLEAQRRRAPVASMIGEIAGSLPTLALPLGPAMKGASLGQKMLQGGLAGAAYGGLYGAGTAEGGLGERAAGAAVGAGTGAVTGAAMPLIGKAIGKVAEPFMRKSAILKDAPLPATVQKQSQALYKAAEQQGVVIKPDVFRDIVRDVVSEGQRKGADPNVTTMAWGAIKRLTDEARLPQPVTLERLDMLRQVVGGSLKEGSAASAAMFGRLSDRMDALAATDVLARDPRAAVSYLGRARSLWQQYAKARTITSAIENSRNAATGFAGGLRNEFRALLRTNPETGKPRFKWTEAERKAIQQVARGSTGTNILRFLGTFGIPIDQGRNWLGAIGGAGFGVGVGMGPAAAAVPALGTAAKFAERAATTRNASVAAALAARGSVPSLPNVAGAATKALAPAGKAAVPFILPWLKDRNAVGAR